MYRPETRPADRIATLVGIGLIHVGLILALLNMTGTIDLTTPQPNLKVFDVNEVPPPPPPVVQPPPKPAQAQKAKPKDQAGRAAPENNKAQASEIKRPEPEVKVPAKPPVQTAPTPGTGAAPTQGAGQRPGAGTGAGGVGNGTGSGGAGIGNGGGGGAVTHPRPLFRPLDGRGFPRGLTQGLPPGARVFIQFTVQPTGQVTNCFIRQSSGNAQLDAIVCAVAQQRFRYEPARRADGTPVAAGSAYMQIF